MAASYTFTTPAPSRHTAPVAGHPWARRVAAAALVLSGGAAGTDAYADPKRAQAQLAFRIVIPHVLSVTDAAPGATIGDGTAPVRWAQARSNGGRVMRVVALARPDPVSPLAMPDVERVATWFTP